MSHPDSLLGGPEGPVLKHFFEIDAQILGVVVAQYLAFGCCHEHAPLRVHTFGVVIVSQCRLEPLGMVAGDGLLDK